MAASLPKPYPYLFALTGLFSLVYTIAPVVTDQAGLTETSILVPALFFLFCIAFSLSLTTDSLRANTRIAKYLSNWKPSESVFWSLVSLVGLIAILSFAWFIYADAQVVVVQRIQPLSLWILLTSCLFIALLEGTTHRITRMLQQKFVEQPVHVWVFTGFLFTFVVFFLHFFLTANGQLDFPEPVLSSEPVADDLRKFLGYSTSTLLQGTYIGNYPPFPLLFFFPLSFLDFRLAYSLLTLLTFGSFVFATFVFPSLVSAKSDKLTTIFLLGVAALFSYGFHWELENGQFNLLAFAFVLASIYLFYHRPKSRWAAYILFTVALQLKLWPGIFILLFVTNDWKASLKRVGGLLLANLAGLFVLGPQVFMEFLRGIARDSDYLWIGNHSIKSFLTTLAESGTVVNVPLWSAILLGVTILAIALVGLTAWRRNSQGLDVHLLLACTLGALLIPSISNDYKLPILAASTLVYLTSITVPKIKTQRALYAVTCLLITIGYTATTYSLGLRPDFLRSSTLILLLMLIVVLISSMALGEKHAKS